MPSSEPYTWGQFTLVLATAAVLGRYQFSEVVDKSSGQMPLGTWTVVSDIRPENGLYPLHLQIDNGEIKLGNQISFGSLGDSAYEYCLKLWLQSGKKEHRYRQMYDKAVQGLHDKLLERTLNEELLYVAEMSGGRLIPRMDHLACFLPGLLALGAYTNPNGGIESDLAQRDMKSARALAYTCYQMYARTSTGLAPEYIEYVSDGDLGGIAIGDSHYNLRPEFVETMYVLHQLTEDPAYREWGWEVFQAIQTNCKTEAAYGSLEDVNNAGNQLPQDEMESFFLAETLKYLFLMFDPDTNLDLQEKV